MSVTVEVALLSGKTATVQVGLEEKVEALRLRAQTTLGVGHGRLVNSFGSILDESVPIKLFCVQDGDALTLQMCNTVQVQASSSLLLPSLATNPW